MVAPNADAAADKIDGKPSAYRAYWKPDEIKLMCRAPDASFAAYQDAIIDVALRPQKVRTDAISTCGCGKRPGSHGQVV